MFDNFKSRKAILLTRLSADGRLAGLGTVSGGVWRRGIVINYKYTNRYN